MAHSWLVLIPPLAVLIVSLIFKRIIPALIVGIISGTYIASYLSGKSPFSIAASYLWAQVEQDTLCIFIFLLILGTLIALMNITGGTHAYAHAIQKKTQKQKIN